jgi:hypothetical protein
MTALRTIPSAMESDYSLPLTHSLTHSQALQPMQGLGRLKKSPPTISILGLAPPISDTQHLCIPHHSIHLRFGLPTRLLPSGVSKVIFLHDRLSCIRTVCPAHLRIIHHHHRKNLSIERIQSTNTITFPRTLLQKAASFSFLKETITEDNVFHAQAIKARMGNTVIALLSP